MARELRDPPIELGDRLPELLPTRLVRRELELAPHFRARQPARFELACALGIGRHGGPACLLLFLFPFYHPLGEAGFRVDEAFSSVTHHYKNIRISSSLPATAYRLGLTRG